MVGNVNGIVESMYAAENARTQQSAASGKTGNFSGYLDAALLGAWRRLWQFSIYERIIRPDMAEYRIKGPERRAGKERTIRSCRGSGYAGQRKE